jgi:serine/threonine protein kinase
MELLHECGYTHNDIKLQNIMIQGSKNKSIMQIVLLDYGFATKFMSDKGKHLKQTDTGYFTGNLLFSNTDQLGFKSTSRRSDL